MTRPVVPPPITDTVAPLGPNARAMLEDAKAMTTLRCTCPFPRTACPSRCSYVCACCESARASWLGGPKQPSPRPTVETEHEALVAKIVAVGAFAPMAKRIAAMLIREYKMVPNETEVPDER